MKCTDNSPNEPSSAPGYELEYQAIHHTGDDANHDIRGQSNSYRGILKRRVVDYHVFAKRYGMKCGPPNSENQSHHCGAGRSCNECACDLHCSVIRGPPQKSRGCLRSRIRVSSRESARVATTRTRMPDQREQQPSRDPARSNQIRTSSVQALRSSRDPGSASTAATRLSQSLEVVCVS